jgi:hypothetical protein
LSRENDEVKKAEYLEALKRNSERLRKLSEDLIEASKASTGNIHASLEKTDLREMIEQALGEYEEKLAEAQLNPVVNIKEEPLYAMADGRLLWRVMSNLLSNCVKYAQPGTRVYLDAQKQDDHHVSIVIKNISKDILNISSEELMERVERWTVPLNILFFVISGAELDLQVLANPITLIVGVIYILSRSAGKISGANLSCRLTKCSQKITEHLGITLLPQAGVALGMALTAATLPDGAVVRNVVLFAVLIYELVGPTMTKRALMNAGEIDPEGRTSARTHNQPKPPIEMHTDQG